MRNAWKILVAKSEGKRPIGKPRHRWEDNIMMDLQEVGREGVESSGSEQRPMSVSCPHGNESSGSIKDGEFLN
jgi:hypothetical protein